MKKKSCGNGGAVESVEIQNQDFPSFHRSLEISPTTRDSHFPTAISLTVKKSKTRPTASAKNRDISIEVRMGTFLTRLDNRATLSCRATLIMSPYALVRNVP